ncbi:carbamate kinase [Nonomuraea soli]|uniref:Carbamate kinase n=1 Tax=Nonomuraea soli TaxID=1032476 RepID=A0A7W0CF36_9ACTN|nr:carbamate kinase [Nonomuraea soli]MBA2890022.1 carbamate kinase [Nonomuraea soli]
MRVVVAIGGNALLRRGERADAATQLRNVGAVTCDLAAVAAEHELLIVHGNGPQVGLLAEESERDPTLERGYPLDTLVAETQGMIGYWLAQGIGRASDRPVAAVVTQVVVDADDPAFTCPSKPVGPYYPEPGDEGAFKKDRYGWRRIVASPTPVRVVELPVIARLLESGCTVIAGGGGGVPVLPDLTGVAAVVDKDLVAALLAERLGAGLLVILTDVPAVMQDHGTPYERPIGTVTPNDLDPRDFAPGSMRPKIEAARRFVTATGRATLIGHLNDMALVLKGEAGTRIQKEQ